MDKKFEGMGLIEMAKTLGEVCRNCLCESKEKFCSTTCYLAYHKKHGYKKEEHKSIASQCPMVMKCLPGNYTCPDCIIRDFVSSVKILGTVYPMEYDYDEKDKGWKEGDFPENVEQYMIEKLKTILTRPRRPRRLT